MQSYLRVKSPWSQLAILMGMLFLGFVLTTIAAGVLLISHGIKAGTLTGSLLDDPKLTEFLKYVQAVSTVTIFLIPAILFAVVVFSRNQFSYLGFRNVPKPYYFLLGILVMFVSLPFVSWLGHINQLVPLPKVLDEYEADAGKQIEAFLKVNSPGDIVLNFFVIALLPAVCEEACFRGGLQRVLIHVFKNPWVGILVTAIFFSAFHLQFRGFLPRMYLGMLLGALYWFSGSLWVSIVSHFFINGIQLVFALYYPKLANENPDVPILLVLPSAVLAFVLIYFMQKQSPVTYAAEYPQEPLTDFHGFPT